MTEGNWPLSKLRRLCVGAGAALLLVMVGSSAGADDAQPPAAPAGSPSPSNQIPTADPDPLGLIGRWIDQGVAGMAATFNGARQTLEGATDRAHEVATGTAKEAAAAVAKLPRTGLVAGREACLYAPNGAPDCRAATEAMCRANGFESGRSLDVQTAQTCPGDVWLSARQPPPKKCTLVSFVTRAICQ